MWKAFWRMRRELLCAQRRWSSVFCSKAFCLKECEYKSLSDKILKLLDIMRGGEEFYLEEAKGILLALLAEVARLNRSSQEENIEEKGKITNMIARSIDYISQYYMEDIRIGAPGKGKPHQRDSFPQGFHFLHAHEPAGVHQQSKDPDCM